MVSAWLLLGWSLIIRLIMMVGTNHHRKTECWQTKHPSEKNIWWATFDIFFHCDMSELHCPLYVTICNWQFLKCQSSGEFSRYFQLEILARQEDIVLRGCQFHTCLTISTILEEGGAVFPFQQNFCQSDEDPVNPGSGCTITFLGGRASEPN